MICNIELDQGERELIKAVLSTEARRSAATAAGLREDLHRGAIEDEERTVARIKRLDYEAATMTLIHSKITEQERDALLAAWYGENPKQGSFKCSKFQGSCPRPAGHEGDCEMDTDAMRGGSR